MNVASVCGTAIPGGRVIHVTFADAGIVKFIYNSGFFLCVTAGILYKNNEVTGPGCKPDRKGGVYNGS